jgi:hypothetical protein
MKHFPLQRYAILLILPNNWRFFFVIRNKTDISRRKETEAALTSVSLFSSLGDKSRTPDLTPGAP